MMGTSMATPITAGTAALVRQYLEEGWYADGTKNSGTSIVPSAALLKAILMNGSQMNMKGSITANRVSLALPSLTFDLMTTHKASGISA